MKCKSIGIAAVLLSLLMPVTAQQHDPNRDRATIDRSESLMIVWKHAPTNYGATFTINVITNICAESIKLNIHSNCPREWITNIVEQLVSNGSFCEIRGHCWAPEVKFYAVYYTGGAPEHRKCQVCGVEQTRRATMGEWK